MAQITIYLDEKTLKKIEGAARREHESISRWIKQRIVHSFENSWPSHYFDLFGALAQDTLKRPEQPKLEQDIPRHSL